MAHILDDLDDEREGAFVVLANEVAQYSLWPASMAAPIGWTTVHGPVVRDDALTYIDEWWQDLRPAAEPIVGYDGVPGLVSAIAADTPEVIAVTCGASTLTYRQLDELSNGYARWLMTVSAVGGVVPVLMPRSTELIAVLLGILKTGSAYLYLAPDDPPARQVQLLRLSEARTVVVGAGVQAPDSDDVTARVVPDRGAELDQTPVTAKITPETPAYVCFTSGSTGKPRGVVVPHRAIIRLVRSSTWMPVHPSDVVLQCAPISFDASTFEIWSALVNGGRLVVYASDRIELAELAEVLTTEAVSILWLTAGLFHRIATDQLPALGGLRVLLAGGDVVSPTHAAAVLAAHPGLTFVNGYGPTENTTFTTCWSTREVTGQEPLPIGRPIDGTGVEVLDENLRPVPVGAIGELWASGEGLALGYLGDAAATAERFVAHPRSPQPGARMYRTGDRVRRRDDGVLDFLGRVDGQVKINGFRVDTAAVEHAIEAHHAVIGAVVVTQVAESGDARLIAYVTPASLVDETTAAGTAKFPAELRRWLSATLPSYCVPWAIRVLREFPLTANGKVDRHALPAAKLQPRNVWNDYIMPGDELEALLAECWGEILGVEPVGVEDDFFDLGGHSLLAADLIGRLHRDHDIDLSARTLYLQPTVAAIAQSLRTSAATNVRTEQEHVSGR